MNIFTDNKHIGNQIIRMDQYDITKLSQTKLRENKNEKSNGRNPCTFVS